MCVPSIEETNLPHWVVCHYNILGIYEECRVLCRVSKWNYNIVCNIIYMYNQVYNGISYMFILQAWSHKVWYTCEIKLSMIGMCVPRDIWIHVV